MKKTLYILLAAVTFSTVSCDMDRESPTSLPFDKAFENIGAIQSLERGAYSRLRTAMSPEAIIAPDIQADYVHAANGFSNTYGNIYRWTFTQEASEISSVWNNFYGAIGLYNFIIDGISYNLGFEAPEGSAERNELNRIQGTAYLMRALSYTYLAERFCADYDKSTAEAEYSGLPLAITYDSEKTPDRSTLKDVYDQIFNDIKEAKRLLVNVAGMQNATTMSIDCVTALEARVLLQTDQHSEALKVAKTLIGNKTYSLVETQEDFNKMWSEDKSSETIFQFFASKTELAYQWGYYFCSDFYNGADPRQCMFMPDFIPTRACLDSYDGKDWRRQAYFFRCSAKEPVGNRWMLPYVKGLSSVAEEMYLVYKFPGNPDLRTSSVWNYYNTLKVFRLAEAYLIAAEAAAVSGGDAATPLNELRKHRGLDPLQSVSLEDVKKERYREMMLEGTRISDLKRWNSGFKRGEPQTSYVSETGGNPWKEGSLIFEQNSDISVEKDNYMLVWPIPASEVFANPSMAAQQNPGWRR